MWRKGYCWHVTFRNTATLTIGETLKKKMKFHKTSEILHQDFSYTSYITPLSKTPIQVKKKTLFHMK